MIKDVVIFRKRKLRFSAVKLFLLLGMFFRISYNGFILLFFVGNISMDIKLFMGSEYFFIIIDKIKCILKKLRDINMNLKDIILGF